MFRFVALCVGLQLSVSLPGQYLSTEAAVDVVAAAHRQGDFDGVVVIAQNGKVKMVSAVGDADRSRKLPNKPETVFRLASLTKQVTALLVMQEVAAVHISLDQPAGESMKTLPEASGRVTIRQLLQHVSGLVNPSDGPDGIVPPFYQRQDGDAGNNTKTALGACSATPKRPPGGQFEYNNCDYIVLGAVLEAVTGKTYPQLVKERIIQPLGLKSWGIFPADPKDAPPMAQGYMVNGAKEMYENPATYGAAGALYGNALDVAKWDTALLTHKLLSPEATETMFHADPKLYGEAFGSWSYDLAIATPPVHLVERQGDIEGTRLLNLLLPQRNASITIIANTEKADLFNTYSRKGLGYDLVVAIVPAAK